ncbi:hypothetical protein BVG19_g804 [[Candida] boidinii]|nr:hypothetical protein BVG19_g804 [[Candida] boidinii]OWB50816.1 hypothetical protein B5S27_g2369 [[Candida] boidinii]
MPSKGSSKGLVRYDPEEDQKKNTKLVGQYTASNVLRDEIEEESANYDPIKKKRLAENESIESEDHKYQNRRFNNLGNLENMYEGGESLSYKDAMLKRQQDKVIEEKRKELMKRIEERKDNGEIATDLVSGNDNNNIEKRKRKQIDAEEENESSSKLVKQKKKSRWEIEDEEEKEKDLESKSILEMIPVIDGIPLTEENLDKLLPQGYSIVPLPSDYKPINDSLPDLTEFNKSNDAVGYMLPEESSIATEFKAANPALINEVPGLRDLQFFKETDMRRFGKLITTRDIPNKDLSPEELKERKIMKLLLKIKNGTPQARKVSLRQLTDNARNYGSKALFDQILPLMMEKSLDDQERHLLVKTVGRILFKLDDLVRPYTHKVLIVIMPLLVDTDLYTRLEGREIVSNLAKAAGLPHMISTLRPDIDHSDEYIRNIVSRTFAVVASSLGIQQLLPFLKAVCNSKKSWLARQTGVKIVQQISILMGAGILSHLAGLISCVQKNITDENVNVRIMTCNALASLAESSAPYGIEYFESVLQPLWNGMKKHRGKALASFLKALGYMIPLMDESYANYYTREIFKILVREFESPDDEMKRTCLKVIQQCCLTEGVDKKFLADEVISKFFGNFWNRRIALDSKISKMCIQSSVAISTKIGCAVVIEKIIVPLKDESEPFRKMAVETVSKVIGELGTFDLDDRQVERLLDGLLYSFQHQQVQDRIFLVGFGEVLSSLGARTQPHLMSIVSAILYRLKNQSPEIRQQSADLVEKLAPVLKICGEEDILVKLGTVLYESLGEVYPAVLGSILAALRSVLSSVNINAMNPPISQILATLTPILRNRHEKVQEVTIGLVGDIADKGKEFINHREWIRISFELLEMLKSYKKSIRVEANKTFGFIAKAIGPADVLVTLLNNLKVQERQLRVSTAVAIGIVAETCSPYTVLPALMNEYRTPDKNVQNGVLKAISFMFEYLGDIGADYVYSMVPLLTDVLIDRDLVHRQTGASVVRHMALGAIGLGYEDAFIHFLNLLWPNIFETSPHVISRILEGIEGCRNAVGCGIVMNYLLGGLFHPARKVRTAYWKVFNMMYVQSCDSMVPFYPRFEKVGQEVITDEFLVKMSENKTIMAGNDSESTVKNVFDNYVPKFDDLGVVELDFFI